MIDYDFYKNVYFGENVDDDLQFKRLARKAEVIANKYTFGRISKLKSGKLTNKSIKDVESDETIESIKFTICELIDYLHSPNKNDSEYDIVYSNLINTGLMYRGFINEE